jgi:hypothetical protein
MTNEAFHKAVTVLYKGLFLLEVWILSAYKYMYTFSCTSECPGA